MASLDVALLSYQLLMYSAALIRHESGIATREGKKIMNMQSFKHIVNELNPTPQNRRVCQRTIWNTDCVIKALMPRNVSQMAGVTSGRLFLMRKNARIAALYI